MFPVDRTDNSCYITLGSAEDRSNGAWFSFVPRPVQTYTFTSKEPSSTTGSVSWQHAHGPQQTPYSSLAFCVSSDRESDVNQLTVTCECCGIPFSVPPYRATRRFCSKRCVYDAKRRHPNASCKNCGKPLYIRASRLTDGQATFCSRQCFAEWQDVKIGKTETVCAECGKTFRAPPSAHKKFCSAKCFGRWASMTRVGQKAPRWDGGLSLLPYPVTFNKPLKRQIRERDSFTCQVCGKRGKHVHHIDYDKDNCKPDNLITLCNSCHAKTNSNRAYWTAELRARICQ